MKYIVCLLACLHSFCCAVATEQSFIKLSEIDGRVWLLDSSGQPFFAHGVTHVGYGHNGEDVHEIANALKELGFNSYGYGCPTFLQNDMPYVQDNNRIAEIATYRGKGAKFFDIFDPREKTRMEQEIERVCLANRNNPNLIGYYWTDLAAWPLKNQTETNWVEFIRGLPKSTPGQEKYQEFLATWNGNDDSQRDLGFLRLIAREYFRICGEANRKFDPDHLIFGDRYMFSTLVPEVIQESLPYIDAVAIQPFFNPGFPRKQFDRVHKLTGKPIILCDFNVTFKEEGKNVFGWKPVENADVAGPMYRDYIKEAFKTPYIIGSFWCNPVTQVKPSFYPPGYVKVGIFGEGIKTRPGLSNAIVEANQFIAANTPGKKENSMNVLMIAVDDLRPELNCYGANRLITPNFDRLAASSTRFDRAYCQQAVCGASRLSIMTGVYPSHSGERSFHVRGWRQRHPDLLTLNRHFGANQFKTFGLGKIYHARGGPDADQAGWDQWINIQEKMYADPVNLEQKSTFNIFEPGSTLGSFAEALEVDDDQYADGKRASRAVDLLSDLAESKERFFLSLGFVKPHLPFVAPKKYWDLYDRDEFSTPKNVGIPPGYPNYAANQSAWELQFYDEFKDRTPKEYTDELNRHLLHGYAACVSYTDACLGRVLDALDQTGLAENTIVALWGDHGFKLGDHASWSKHTNFEVDTRVPLLIRVPNKSGGQVSKSLVEMVDLYPTLCELAKIETPPHCQGRSFANLLDSPDSKHRDLALSIYPAEEGISEKVASGLQDTLSDSSDSIGSGYSIRNKNYRYTEWRTRPNQRATASVLTNMQIDPEETTNLIDQPEHAKALLNAKKLLSQRLRENPLKMENKPSSEKPILLLDFEESDSLARNGTSHEARVELVDQTHDGGGKSAAKATVADDATANQFFGTGFMIDPVDLSKSKSLSWWFKADFESSFNLQIHSGSNGNSGISVFPFNSVGSKGQWKRVSAPLSAFAKPPWAKGQANLSNITKIQATAFGNGPYQGRSIWLDSFAIGGEVQEPVQETDDFLQLALDIRRERIKEPKILNRGEPVDMFDGETLNGWFAIPRVYVPRDPRFSTMTGEKLFDEVIKYYENSDGQFNRIANKDRVRDKGVWTVEDGIVIGGQTPGSIAGAYLMSEKKYGDFELTLEANPDYPIDTGIMVRAHKLGSVGFQVLVDNRPNGTIGGFYGNTVGNFFAYPFVFEGDEEPLYKISNIRPGNPNALRFRGGQFPTDYAASLEDFLKVWKPNDWNEIRIRCTGEMPLIETWINGVAIAKIDTATLADVVPNYDPERIFNRIGRKGHIGLEVHDSPTRDRWAPGAKARWRNVRIRELEVE
ncbi:MAG: sulfatase-like hydrolase/transferase [Planctomycetota bacterium]